MLQESDIIPYHLSHPPGERAIVLAPHPDDETLGCGGTIRLLLKSKRPVKVIFLTSGEKADPSNKLSQIVHDEAYMSQRNTKFNENNLPEFSFSNPPSPLPSPVRGEG